MILDVSESQFSPMPGAGRVRLSNLVNVISLQVTSCDKTQDAILQTPNSQRLKKDQNVNPSDSWRDARRVLRENCGSALCALCLAPSFTRIKGGTRNSREFLSIFK
jgi:hypothetical protein